MKEVGEWGSWGLAGFWGITEVQSHEVASGMLQCVSDAGALFFRSCLLAAKQYGIAASRALGDLQGAR